MVLHCVLSLLFVIQMYIALISLHALVMVVFHFLNCFEDDWTSEFVLFKTIPHSHFIVLFFYQFQQYMRNMLHFMTKNVIFILNFFIYSSFLNENDKHRHTENNLKKTNNKPTHWEYLPLPGIYTLFSFLNRLTVHVKLGDAEYWEQLIRRSISHSGSTKATFSLVCFAVMWPNWPPPALTLSCLQCCSQWAAVRLYSVIDLFLRCGNITAIYGVYS